MWLFFLILVPLVGLLVGRLRSVLTPQKGLAAHKKDDDASPLGKGTAPQTFEEAVEAARELKNHSASLRLTLYALYKQATIGDAPADLAEYNRGRSVGVLDATSKYKFQYWEQFRGMGGTEAAQRYVRLVAGDTAAGDRGDAVRCERGAVRDEGEEALDDDELEMEMEEAMAQGFAGAVGSTLAVDEAEEREIAEADSRLPLHGAARRGDAAACAKLLESVKPIDTRDEDGHTALHWACDGGSIEVARVLIEDGGADHRLQNVDGLTPLHMACACDHEDVARFLLAKGASPYISDEDGCTPLDLASPRLRITLSRL